MQRTLHAVLDTSRATVRAPVTASFSLDDTVLSGVQLLEGSEEDYTSVQSKEIKLEIKLGRIGAVQYCTKAIFGSQVRD